MGIDVTQLIEIEKFIEHRLNKTISDRENKRLLKGSYKEEGSDEIFSEDNFMAYELQRCSALEVYECYIEYFNHTIQKHDEKRRIAVCARW